MSQTPPSMRERILEAAFGAFMRHGYSGTSTAQIARLAQVSKRDLYANFGSKQAMLAACVLVRAERMRRPLTLPPPTSLEGLRETLIGYGAAILREISRPEVVATFRLAIVEAENAPDVAQTLDRLGRAENAQVFLGLITAARDAGWLGDGEPGDMAALFMGVLLGGGFMVRLLMRVTTPPTEEEARRRAEAATRDLFRAYGGAVPG